MINETDLLIERIKNWKAEKDEKEYKAKIEEENKVANFMEKMNTEIFEESKKIIKIFKTLKDCEINTENFKCYYIKFVYNNRWGLRFDFKHCFGYVFPDSTNVSFKKKDSTGFTTNYDSNPPHSSEFTSFFDDFETFKKRFYDFVELSLK